MRIISYSLLAVAVFGVWELKSDQNNIQTVAELSTPYGVDTSVIGGAIPVEHVAKWEARNRIQKVSSAPRVYYQAFPGDADLEYLNEGERMAGQLDMMPTASIKKMPQPDMADQ